MNPREYAALFEVEDRHWWFAGLRREIVRELARVAPQGGFRRWLDAGSGTGGLLANLEVPGRPPGVGLDFAAEGLGLARRRPRPPLALSSVRRLPFPGSHFGPVPSIDRLCPRHPQDV